MSITSGKVPADRNVVGSRGGDAAAEVRHAFLRVISFFSADHLPTHLSSSTCIPLLITHGTASSSTIGKVLADHNVDVSSGADAAAEVSHVFFCK